jgi:hypothetical protein
MGVEEQFILLSLGLTTIGTRIGVRWRQVGPGGWQLDDYLMPFTGVSCQDSLAGQKRKPTCWLLVRDSTNKCTAFGVSI